MLPTLRRRGFLLSGIVVFALLSACSPQEPALDLQAAYDPATDSLWFPGEAHLRRIRQLTFGGNNAEAYWSFDSRRLLFQSDWSAINTQGCDQIFEMNADGAPLDDGSTYRLVSTGTGRTTCSYFLPDGRRLFASTHAADPACPTPVSFSQGRYVWPVYSSYDIYVVDADGSNLQLLVGGEGYDAEATVSPDGRFMVFTSTRSGDLDLWRYEFATGAILPLTNALGYDGGAFFSPDGTKIVWRASRPTGDEAGVYQALLADGFVEPKALNIFIANADGTDARQVTDLAGANWAPFYHPDGKRILFTSNHHDTQGGRLFDIFMIHEDGSNLEQITRSGTFDAFPMFSPDGKYLAFSSNRTASREPSRETNVFVAEWVE
jgi:Tol biopolymer transport system component